MTQLYLIRHGIAIEREKYEQDEFRPLTDIGQQKTLQVAQRLSKMAIKFDVILTSPLVRARQTAEILQGVSLTEKIIELNCLAPRGILEDFMTWWCHSSYNQKTSSVALVGHQPNLCNWAETLIWGDFQDKLILKKAGIIGINLCFDKTLIGSGELFLLTSPKWFL